MISFRSGSVNCVVLKDILTIIVVVHCPLSNVIVSPVERGMTIISCKSFYFR